MRTFRLALSTIAAAALLSACDGSPSDGGRRDPARLDVVSGDLQPQATAGAELPEPLVVRVVDDRGRPVRNQLVNFVVTAGGGTVFAGSALTDRDGEASERWTLGTVAGDTQKVEARAVNSAGQPIVFATFRAVARPAAPTVVERVSPPTVAGAAGAQLADSLSVRVKDQYGNGVPGVSVGWSIVRGGGAVSPTTSVTGANGVAKTAWTLGLRLDSTHLAQAAVGATGLLFEATPSLPPGAVLAKVSGDNQTAPAGSAFPAPFVVRVTTAGGAPIRGARVRWEGAGADSLTDAAGESRHAATAGPAAGTQSFAATLQGAGTVTFTATATDPTLSVVTTVPGTALDYRAGRLLWVDAGGTLRVRTGGTDETVANGAGSVTFGRVYPGGAVYVDGGQLFDWRGGGTPVALGAADSVRVDGSWMAWLSGPSTVTLRDLAAGTNTAQVTAGAFDVGPNGDLAYSSGGDLVRRRGGTATVLAAGAAPLRIVTDGINVLYSRLDVANRTALYRYSDAAGVTAVSSVPNASAGILLGAANAGWSAVSSVQQVTTVSPSGTVRRVSVPSGFNVPVVRDVSSDGQVIFDGFDAATGGTARFLLGTGSDTPARIGPALDRAYFDGTTAYVLWRGTVYRAS